MVGDIAGRAYAQTAIKNCVNVGTVNATKADDARFGGIDGHNAVTSVNSYTIAGSAVNTATSGLAKTGDVGAVEKTDAELNTTDIVTALGEAWELAAGKLTLKIVASAGTVDEDETPDSDTTTATPPEVTTKPSDDVTTKPADVTTKPADVTTTPADVTTTEPKDDDTTATTPVDNDTTTKAPVTTTAPTTTETPKKEKGCGGFAVAAQLIAVIGAGLTVVVLKKKI